MWEARTGGQLGDPYEYVLRMASPVLPFVAPLAELEQDTLLILALCFALGVVLLMRQRQQTH